MVALWPHRFGQGAALLTDPLTLLPLSLLDARRRTRPRAGRPASSRRCKGVVLVARAASPVRDDWSKPSAVPRRGFTKGYASEKLRVLSNLLTSRVRSAMIKSHTAELRWPARSRKGSGSMDNKPETFEAREPNDTGRQWTGFAEIDQAIAEDRLTEYRLKKAWADPLSRMGIIVACLVIIAFCIFVAVSEFAG